mgnify:CR=1 FL=1
MAASLIEITGWVTKPPEGTKFVVIVCDTFDHDDYPCYFDSAEKCVAKVSSPGEMQRVMEVYDLSLDVSSQISEHRAWHMPKSSGVI